MVALATIEDVAAVSSPVPSSDEDKVQRCIEFASARVIRKLKRGADPFTETTETVTVYARSTGELFLPGLNITAVASVELYGQTLTSDMYRFTASGRLLRLRGTGSSSGYFDGLGWDDAGNGSSVALDDWGWPSVPITVEYTHGWSSPPDDIVSVVAELAAAKWLSGANNATNLASYSDSIDGYSHAETYVKPNAEASQGGWSAEHLEILNSYRRMFQSVRVVDAGGSPARTR